MKEFRVCITLENAILWGILRGELYQSEVDALRNLLKKIEAKEHIIIMNEYQKHIIETNEIRYIRIYDSIE